MLKMAAIVPQNFLEITAESKMHMALAHLVGEEAYAEYTYFFKHRNKDSFCILDNGVIEGNPMPIDIILERAALIQADEIVLPDAYKDAAKTIEMIDEAIQYIETHPDAYKCKLMAVPQGASMEEWVDCAKQIIDKFGAFIHTIGIPKHLIDTCGQRDARLFAISSLKDEIPNIDSYDIHLLGCWKTPLEVLTIAKASEQGIIPEVRSCDSAIPYVYARSGLRFSDDDRPDSDPIEFEKGHCNTVLLTYNILAWHAVGDPSSERSIYFL